MATCSKCFKQIPDDAVHCGFCGAARNKPKEKKTLFGYASLSPEALAKERALQRQTRSSSEVVSVDLAAPDSGLPIAESVGPTSPGKVASPIPKTSSSLADVSTEAFEQTLMAVPTASVFDASNSAGASSYQPALAAPASLPSAGPPAVIAPLTPQESSAHQAKEISAHRLDDASGRQIPATLSESPEAPTSGGREGLAIREIAEEHKIPPTIRQDSTAKVGVAYKPVLASQSLAEDLAPREPGKTAMRITMFLSSLFLLGIFCAPGLENGALVFAWDLLPKMEVLDFIKQIYFVLGGVIFLAAALLPLPYLVRAVISLLFGLFPLGVYLGIDNIWQSYTIHVALVVLPAALFLRWTYRGSALAKVLVGLGVVAVLCTALVPIHGTLPILSTFDGIGDASALQVLITIFPNILICLAFLSLLGLLGKGSTGFVQVWAIGLLLYLPLHHWIPLLDFKAGNTVFNVLPVIITGLAMLIFLTMSSLGLFQLLSPISRPRTLKWQSAK